MAATIKLPGIYFSVEPRQIPDLLPRMDVAAFVGFAASGPLHVPVMVEDVGRFRDIFGPDVPLAWDPVRGEIENSWLGQCVESFFRQGGRRCWVVRVADENTAETLRVQLPGLWPAGEQPPYSPPHAGTEALARSPGWWATEQRAGTRLRREQLDPLAVNWNGSDWTVDLALSPLQLAQGDLLELPFPYLNLLLLLFVGSARTIISTADPSRGFERITGREGFWFEPEPESPPVDLPLDAAFPALREITGLGLTTVRAQFDSASPAHVPGSARRLTFDVFSWRGSTIQNRLNGLGFSPAHPRFWAVLPEDSKLFEVSRGRQMRVPYPERDALIAEASSPRFPFAGPTTPAKPYLPLGMATTEDVSRSWMPLPPDKSRLAYDGLALFSDALFLDPRLAFSLTGGLLAEAENRHYEEAVKLGTPPLRGLHSTLPVHEISMLAAPDAVHRGWTREAPEKAELLAPPELLPIPGLDEFGRIAIRFQGPTEADSYLLQIAETACFRTPLASEVVPAELASGQEYVHYFVPHNDCPMIFRFRVRSERFGEASSWSRTRSSVIPFRQFEKCGENSPDSGALVMQVMPATLLQWEYERPTEQLPGDTYQLQMAIEPGFQAPVNVEAGDATARSYAVSSAEDNTRYFRVRTIRPGFKGDWSNTVAIQPSSLSNWSTLPEKEFDDEALLAIHRGMLRYCGARADAVALLSLPRHYRDAAVHEHIGLLLPRVKSDREPALATGVLRIPALTIGEEEGGVCSYGACYHPWTAGALPLEDGKRGEGLRVVYTPPDGFAAGSIAAKSLQAGAWISPANQPLTGVVAVDPKLDLQTWSRLTGLQVNLVIEQARGFVFLNSETLSAKEELRELNVRRLMILLRRLALREGETFVFEPNSEDFRGLVRQRFERWMNDMYTRGAFQGRTPAAAYAVIVDESLNSQRSIKQGRFLVELRVAPSRPFRYLNIRLSQTAPERLTVNEI